MLITREHYAHIRDAIAAKFTATDVAERRRQIVEEGKARDVEKRLRHDLLYAAGLTPWVCANLYTYANDTHIDTALRRIVGEVYA